MARDVEDHRVRGPQSWCWRLLLAILASVMHVMFSIVAHVLFWKTGIWRGVIPSSLFSSDSRGSGCPSDGWTG